MIQRAFTLIEVLAATALSALLMLAVLSAVRSTAASQRTLEQRQYQADSYSAVTQLIEWDLRQARTLKATSQGLEIQGFSGLDRVSRQATHRPVIVNYLVQEMAGKKWLVRRQVEMVEEAGSGGTWLELLCPNVVLFSTSAIAVPESKDGVEPTGSLPSRLQLTLRIADIEQPIVRDILLQ